jgi:hypothetical protein
LQIYADDGDPFPSIQISGATGVISTGSGSVAPTDAITLGDSGAVTYAVTPTIEFDDTIVMEGATADAFETTISATDPEADRTITLPDASVTVGQQQIQMAYGGIVANHVDAQFFIAPVIYTVTAINVVWGVEETTGAMDVMVERLQGTEACGAGDDLQVAVVDATGTANTVTTPALTATGANLILAAGNRLCVDLTATPNEVTNLTVIVTVIPS